GGVDVQPIAHLYKTQIYQLADFVGVPAEIVARTPTTDTYSAPTSQEEFFFRLPFEVLDLLWFAKENNLPPSEASRVMNFTETQVDRVYRDLTRKQNASAYLRAQPMALIGEEPGNGLLVRTFDGEQ